MTSADIEDWERSASRHFLFHSRFVDETSGVVHLVYELDGMRLTEKIELPREAIDQLIRRGPAVRRALDLLHWVAGVSYWKAGCPPEVHFAGAAPDAWQAQWLNQLYRKGLAEFAHQNDLDPDSWPLFHGSGSVPSDTPEPVGLARRSLVPMGGGKDSLVAWARLIRAGEQPDSVQIGAASLIARIGEHLNGRHWLIGRKVDSRLAELNRRGAWNGHVPVTAINSAILVLAALLLDYNRVVFANERSADEASLLDSSGRPVNHQFSKSFEFERMLDQWVRRYIEPDLRVFSLLRRDRELAICMEFAGLEEFHPLFSSCNRNFHLDGPRTTRWCGQCPKCLFVFLGLAPFMKPERLKQIFGHDLLDKPELISGFSRLLALDGTKPFECVGEANEARGAIVALGEDPDWKDHAVVGALVGCLEGLAVPSVESLCQAGGAHLIPGEWLNAA